MINISKKINEKKQGQKIPLILHKDAFRNRMVKFKDGRIVNLPAPNRSDLTHTGYNIVEKQSPSLWIEDSILITGEILEPMILKKDFLIIIRR